MSSTDVFSNFELDVRMSDYWDAVSKCEPHLCASKKKKKESIYFLGSIWAKIHHADSEVGPMSFVIKLNMSCKSFKLHLQRESHIIRFFITEIAIQYVLVWLAKAVI